MVIEIRVVMAIDDFYPNLSGAPMHVMELGKALAKRGVKPTVLTCSYPGQPHEQEINGIKVVRMPGRVFLQGKTEWPIKTMSIKAIRGVYEHIKYGGYDIVHGMHMYSPLALTAIYSGHRWGLPTVLTNHTSHLAKGIWRAVYQPIKAIAKRADRFIAVSQAAKALYLSLGIDESKISIIPNGVDVSKFNSKISGSKARAWLKIGSDPLIVSVMRVEKRKGPKYLITAFSNVLETIPRAKLVIVGGGPDKEKILAQIKGLKIEKSVLMLGPILHNKVPEVVAAADVFVLPSLVDSSPLVLPEAMAVGAPIVCTRVGGIPEMVNDQFNGFMVEPADADALANGIIQVLTDKKFSRKIRTNALKTVHEKFTWDRIAERTIEVYEDAKKHARSRVHR